MFFQGCFKNYGLTKIHNDILWFFCVPNAWGVLRNAIHLEIWPPTITKNTWRNLGHMYTLENQHVPWKSLVGRCIPYWNSPFLGDMLVFGGVDGSDKNHWSHCPSKVRVLCLSAHVWTKDLRCQEHSCLVHLLERLGFKKIHELVGGFNPSEKY